MNGDIPSQVIDFINTNYPQLFTVTADTLFSDMNLGLTDTVGIIMELEDHFGITQNSTDADGITTVGGAIALIESKL